MRWTILFFSVILILPYVFSSNTTITDDESDPLISGLDPFFKLTHGFIKLIYPKTIVEFMTEELDIKVQEVETSEQADKALDDLQDSFSDWQKWLKFFKRYAACVVCGVVAFVIMLFTGFILCCTCCCRKCCCHDCSNDEYPSPKDKSCRIVCGLLFFCFVTMILAGSILGFLANKAIHNQLDTKSSDGAISQIKGHLNLIDSYMDTVLDDVDNAIDSILISEVNKLKSKIRGLPKDIENKFRLETDITEITNEAVALSERMKIISEGVTFFESKRKPTNELQNLVNDYNSLKTSSGCSNCPDFTGPTQLSNLEAEATTLSNIVKDLGTTVDANFKNGTKNVTDEAFVDMEEQINKLLGEVDQIKISVSDKKSQLDENYKDIQKPLKDIIVDLNDPDTLDTIDRIKNIIFYAGIGVCSIGALICLLYYIGLLSGCCGAAPNEGSCNRSVGGNFLVSGITFTFLFFEILMVALIILFTVGMFAQGEICGPLTPKIEESDTIESLNKLIRIGMLKGNDMNLTIDLKFTMSECKKDEPIYDAFKLDQIIDLKKILKFTEYDFEGLIDKAINNTKNSKPAVVIWNNDMNDAYTAIKAAKIENINTGSNWKGKLDLAQLKSSDKAKEFEEWIKKYEKLQNDLIKHDDLINEKKAGIDKAWDDLKQKAQSTESNIPSKLTLTMEIVVKGALQPFITFTKDSINILIKEIVGLGKCNKLYKAISGGVDTLCPKTVDPFNAFWFSLGWQLFFMIPAFIVAIVLNNLYKKQDDEEDGFDDFKPYVQHDNAAYNPHPTSPHHAQPPPSYHQQYQTPPNAPAHYAHNNIPQQQFGY
ncbi:unnamed protein product [Dimorphilus gyrociliatus]|uniref:Uncharacterized protein n=1 Tax=Dimorphilus gyrociliatus TaxID=2664684 RepID=A0A7I8V9B6_9ANNE|nr:unnamed protein product [Dimorphilus gyrociliatus]